MWCHTPIIPTYGRQRQAEYGFDLVSEKGYNNIFINKIF
jgi:hypothetical protein